MLEIIVRGFLGILPYLAAMFLGLLVVYRWLHDHLTPFNDEEELCNDNVAAGISRGGAYLGVMLASAGSLLHSESSYQLDLLMFLLDGVFAVGFFTLASYALDWALLHKVNNSTAIHAGNKAVGIAEACGFIGLGIIMLASFSGGGQSLWAGQLSALLFSCIGLAVIMLIIVMYDFIWKKRSRQGVDNEIKEGNMAAAIDIGSIMLAMAITLWFSISGDFTGWWNDIATFTVAAVASVFAVALSRTIAFSVLVPRSVRKTSSHHGNTAVSITAGLATIGAGFIAGAVMFI